MTCEQIIEELITVNQGVRTKSTGEAVRQAIEIIGDGERLKK